MYMQAFGLKIMVLKNTLLIIMWNLPLNLTE